MAALTAPAAFGQIDRVLRYSQAKTDQDMQEIATVLGAIADLREIAVDRGQRSLAIQGTSGQAALAEWLFAALDRPVSEAPSLREYRMDSGDEASVRVFYLPHMESVQELQEVATLVRSMAGIRRLFTCVAPKAVVIRSGDE